MKTLPFLWAESYCWFAYLHMFKLISVTCCDELLLTDEMSFAFLVVHLLPSQTRTLSPDQHLGGNSPWWATQFNRFLATLYENASSYRWERSMKEFHQGKAQLESFGFLCENSLDSHLQLWRLPVTAEKVTNPVVLEKYCQSGKGVLGYMVLWFDYIEQSS